MNPINNNYPPSSALTEQQAHAYRLYTSGHFTQKEIADTVGVTVRTVYTWIRTFSWQQLKDAAVNTPVLIAEKLTAQVMALLNSIARRDESQRFATSQEADVLRKLVNCVDKFRRLPTMAQSMQSIRGLIHFIDQKDPTLGHQVQKEYNAYFDQQLQNGFHPHEMEHNANPLAFVDRDLSSTETYLDKDEEPYELPYDLLPVSLKKQQEAELEIPTGSIAAGALQGSSSAAVQPEMSGSWEDVHPLPPVSFPDFEEYKWLLKDPTPSAAASVLFKGKMVNRAWLQYNLFQYCYKPHTRHFIITEAEYHELHDTETIYNKIRQYHKIHG